jgi:nucleotide-binding universal stress UspA family protein
VIQIADILCPIDFSDHSCRALGHAAAIARWYEARLTVLYVYTHWPTVAMIPVLGTEPLPPVELAAADRERLVHHVTRLADQHARQTPRVEIEVRDAADAGREILAHAAATPADLIVMGTHGRSGVEHLLLGSITERVVRKAACPVMVVPHGAQSSPGREGVPFKNIMCPFDFSESALSALTYAMSLAEESDARLTLLHAVEIPTAFYEVPLAVYTDLSGLRAAAQSACERRLRDLVPDEVRTYCSVETLAADGKAAKEIVRVAAERKVDLLAMGAHGHGAVNEMLFGSNTHAVMRAATCPVLVVRAHTAH